MSLWTATDNAGGKPKYLTTSEKTDTYGADAVELSASSKNITAVNIVKPGSGYTAAPTVSFVGGGGGLAAAAATINVKGPVTGVNMTVIGNGAYTSAPTVTLTAPTAVTFAGTTAVSVVSDTITMTAHPFIFNNKVTYSNGGFVSIAGLTNANTYYIIVVDANTVKLSATQGGIAINITALGGLGNHSLTGETATALAVRSSSAKGIAHTGWVKRTAGTGGRAGRVSYEVLVAGGIALDAADDLILPDA